MSFYLTMPIGFMDARGDSEMILRPDPFLPGRYTLTLVSEDRQEVEWAIHELHRAVDQAASKMRKGEF